MNADGRGYRRLTRDGKRDPDRYYSSPSLSRDGRRLVFSRGGSVFAARSDATGRRFIAGAGPDGIGRSGFSNLSPDGRSVAFLSEEAKYATYDVFEAPFAGGAPRRVRSGVRSAAVGGGHLAVIPGQPFQYPSTHAVCLVRTGQSDCSPRPSIRSSRAFQDVAISPQGNYLATITYRLSALNDSYLDIYSLATGRRVREVAAGRGISHPTWSPDGQSIAFNGVNGLYTVSLSHPANTTQLIRYSVSDATWGGPAGSVSPSLRLHVAVVRHGELILAGRVARSARAQLFVTFLGGFTSGQVRNQLRTVAPRHGRFRLRLRITGRGRLYECHLVVAYTGDGRYRRETVAAQPCGRQHDFSSPVDIVPSTR